MTNAIVYESAKVAASDYAMMKLAYEDQIADLVAALREVVADADRFLKEGSNFVVTPRTLRHCSAARAKVPS